MMCQYIEVINITRPIINTIYSDTSTYTVKVTCSGGSGYHLLHASTGNGTSLVTSSYAVSASYTFTETPSSTIQANDVYYTCVDALTYPQSEASEQFIFNVNGNQSIIIVRHL
jgi:hypothetical protein